MISGFLSQPRPLSQRLGSRAPWETGIYKYQWSIHCRNVKRCQMDRRTDIHGFSILVASAKLDVVKIKGVSRRRVRYHWQGYETVTTTSTPLLKALAPQCSVGWVTVAWDMGFKPNKLVPCPKLIGPSCDAWLREAGAGIEGVINALHPYHCLNSTWDERKNVSRDSWF